MPKEQREMIGHPTFHRDSREPSGHLTIVKSVEITDLCPGRKPPQVVRLDYAPGKEGLYVEIDDSQVMSGFALRNIFLVPRLADLAERGLHDWTAIKVARDLGLPARGLTAIILEHAPKEHL